MGGVVNHIEICNKALEKIVSDEPPQLPVISNEDGNPEFTELLAHRIALELLPKVEE
jgi:hypothetical protein